MKILIIGGTNFIGRVLVEQLLEKSKTAGWELCLFNRGKTNPDLFPNIRRIVGDRQTDDIYKLCEEEWDVAIDLSCYYVLPFEPWLAKFKSKVKRYIFVSTVSVYDSEQTVGKIIGEDAPVLPCTEDERVNGKPQVVYGELKAECERVLLAHKDLDSIIFRPSLVYGKYDFTDRLYYWLYRVKTESKILVPDVNFQDSYTFVEDIAKSIVQAVTIEKHSQVYNCNTHGWLSLSGTVERMAAVMQTNPQIVKVSPDYLATKEIAPWKDICLWLPDAIGQFDNSRLKNDFNPPWDSFEVSIKKTAAYYEGLGWPVPKAGISLEREGELLGEIGK